jgi:hypothetical protein
MLRDGNTEVSLFAVLKILPKNTPCFPKNNFSLQVSQFQGS